MTRCCPSLSDDPPRPAGRGRGAPHGGGGPLPAGRQHRQPAPPGVLAGAAAGAPRGAEESGSGEERGLSTMVWPFVLSASLYAVSDTVCHLAERTGSRWLCALTARLPCPPPDGPHGSRCRGRCAPPPAP